MEKDGLFYRTLTVKRGDSAELKKCIEDVVQNLLNNPTDFNRPGMLLGKIQSGKTAAFIGTIALAFDNSYDMAVILTKGTKALAEQTMKRLKRDFHELMEDDKVQIHDILIFPDYLPKWVLNQKLIVVAKKETNNLRRLINALELTYPDLSNKKLLIVDDEADYASIGFTVNVPMKSVELTKIASQINELRNKVAASDYLQVTATPYSLYLQPDDIDITTHSLVFKPIKPAFTVTLSSYPGYIGGDFYFNERNEENSLASFVYVPITEEELNVLRKEDRRVFKLKDSLTSPKINTLRNAIIQFIVGACIRRIQQKNQGEREKKYSFVVHTERQKDAHAWQERVVKAIREALIGSVNANPELLKKLITNAYHNLSKSVELLGTGAPNVNEVIGEVIQSLEEDYLIIIVVNSDQEAAQLLDDKGQLRLTTPMNIYIGGQILDRGVTIDNLIGFYYGRRPKRYQQDTVLQHSRMFGNRAKEDLSVTRFYTALPIYNAMNRINDFDCALRDEFDKLGHDAGVVFIYKDPNNRILPCSPNKIKLSATTTLRPYKRMLPYGFQTKPKGRAQEIMKTLDELIDDIQEHRTLDEPFKIDLQTAKLIVDRIHRMFIYNHGYEWDCEAFKACMEFLSYDSSTRPEKGKVWCLVRQNRNASRIKQDGSFFDAPDTASTEGAVAKSTAINIPMLMLFRQNGRKSDGWNSQPFWWPVLVAPGNTRTTVFTTEAIELD
jgi:hypothetical protein